MTGQTDVLIGIDVGTTAVKIGGFGVGLGPAPLSRSLREHPLQQPQPSWQVQDPVTLLGAIDDAVAECVAGLGNDVVRAVSLSTAMHGLLALDDDRRPLTPLLTWADGRAEKEAYELRDADDLAQQLSCRTGTPVHPMSPLVKLRWFARHEPELLGRARWWVGLKDYVIHHLTGELVTELSSASGTGLLNLESRTWDPDAVRLAGIDLDQLPPVRATTTVLALSRGVARTTGLPVGLPVVVGAADGPLGNLGTGAIMPGVAGLSVGTSGAVRVAVSEPRTDPAGRLFCYALTDDLWLTGGAVSNGGNTLRWAGETFAPDLVRDGHNDREVLELAARAPAGSEGLLMLPYVLGERAPLWDPTIAGAFLGIRAHHHRSHFIRAAIEGVCLQLAVIVDILDAVAEVKAIRATGGVFRSNLWCQIMAGTLRAPLFVDAGAGGTALGAAALGWYALGGAATLSEAVTALGGPGPSATSDPVVVRSEDRDAFGAARAHLDKLLAGYQLVQAVFADSHARTP